MNAEIIHPQNGNISESLFCNLKEMLNDLGEVRSTVTVIAMTSPSPPPFLLPSQLGRNTDKRKLPQSAGISNSHQAGNMNLHV